MITECNYNYLKEVLSNAPEESTHIAITQDGVDYYKEKKGYGWVNMTTNQFHRMLRISIVTIDDYKVAIGYFEKIKKIAREADLMRGVIAGFKVAIESGADKETLLAAYNLAIEVENANNTTN